MAKKMNSTEQKVSQLIEPVVKGLGLGLWDIVFEKEGANWILRVVIEKDGPVDISDCEKVSRAIDPILDEADPIEQSYFLEVSSPGTERELNREEHFKRFVGETVQVRLIRPQDSRRDFTGILKNFDKDSFILLEDGTEYKFSINDCAFVKATDVNSNP